MSQIIFENMIDNNFTEQNSSKKSVADSSISRRSKYAQSVRYSDNKVKDSNLDFNVNTLLYSNSHDMNIVKQDFRSLATTSWDFRPSNYAKILNQIGPVTPLSSTKTNSSTFESIGSTGSYKTYDESNKEDTSELSIDLILSSPMFKNSPLKTNSCEKFHSDHNTQDESTDDESLSFEDSRDVELTDLLSELKDSKVIHYFLFCYFM